MGKLIVHRDAYKRKAYIRKDGVKVKSAKVDASTFKVKDRGAKGRTPASKRWSPKEWTHTGWEKGIPVSKRRSLALKGHRGDKLATARGLQRLANLTTDKSTRMKAEADSTYFFKEYAKQQGQKSTARTPKR